MQADPSQHPRLTTSLARVVIQASAAAGDWKPDPLRRYHEPTSPFVPLSWKRTIARVGCRLTVFDYDHYYS